MFVSVLLIVVLFSVFAGAGDSLITVVLFSVLVSPGGLVTVVSFFSHAPRRAAAPARMQMYFFMDLFD